MNVPQAAASAFVRRDGNRFTYLLREDFPAFAGHFPQHPLLPAVAQLVFAVDAAGRMTGKTLRLACAERAKFTAPVHPGTAYTVTLETGAEGAFKAVFGSEDGKQYGVAKFTVREVV